MTTPATTTTTTEAGTTTEAPSPTGTGGTTDGGDAGKTFTQADLDRIVGERLSREKAKFADYDDLKKQAAEAARLRKERESESEKAVREARESAAAEERAKNTPRLVSAEFRAAAKGVLSTEQRDALLEDLDLTKYLTDTGEVDVAKVEKKVAAFAPKADDGKGKRNFPDLGQGKRDSKPADTAQERASARLTKLGLKKD